MLIDICILLKSLIVPVFSKPLLFSSVYFLLIMLNIFRDVRTLLNQQCWWNQVWNVGPTRSCQEAASSIRYDKVERPLLSRDMELILWAVAVMWVYLWLCEDCSDNLNCRYEYHRYSSHLITSSCTIMPCQSLFVLYRSSFTPTALYHLLVTVLLFYTAPTLLRRLRTTKQELNIFVLWRYRIA